MGDKLKLDSKIPKFGTSDNASNMIRAMNMSLVELYTCANHTQQLSIQDAFKKVRDIDNLESMADIAEKCRALANHLKRADNSRLLLHAECQVTNHYPKSIPIANDTR